MTHDTTKQSISLQDIRDLLNKQIDEGITCPEIARRAGIDYTVLFRFLSTDNEQQRSMQAKNILKVLTYLDLIKF